ncbi:MAG: hypothetical protein C0606_16135 [Hyphomicrobiales bacterium]|nr:MAG: hypothetical protein C0606_16135 [Hyphomicrobiales bacterium]
MADILIVYASLEGQTRKICCRTANKLQRQGHNVSVLDAHTDGEMPDAIDGAIIAGPIHYEKHDDKLVQFLADHKDRLAAIPTAFVTVSLSAGSKDQKERDAAKAITNDLLDHVGLAPAMKLQAAGAVHDDKLGFFKRMMLHRILRQKGVTPDASGHTEFTDWKSCDAFVNHFVREHVPERRKASLARKPQTVQTETRLA